MSTSDVLMEQALSLAGSGTSAEDAVRELLTASGERRVAVVRARQQLIGAMDEARNDPTTTHAVELLDEVLSRLPV